MGRRTGHISPRPKRKAAGTDQSAIRLHCRRILRRTNRLRPAHQIHVSHQPTTHCFAARFSVNRLPCKPTCCVISDRLLTNQLPRYGDLRSGTMALPGSRWTRIAYRPQHPLGPRLIGGTLGFMMWFWVRVYIESRLRYACC